MFYIQDGNFTRSLTTHEAILNAANEKTREVHYGAGVFAFVTSDGASLIFDDTVLSEFLKNGKFTLIIGIDDITNVKTINKLNDLKSIYKDKLEIKVFLHKKSNTLFHPKFVWFKFGEKINLITGSSNLTTRGLRRNFEAFTSDSYMGDAADEFETYWNEWIKANENNLYEIDHEDVIKKAEKNAKRFSTLKPAAVEDDAVTPVEEIEVPESIEDEDYNAWRIEEEFEVFIGEISKNRHGQAEIGKHAYQNFFGAGSTSTGVRRILLRNVNDLGHLGEIEARPPVVVSSSNYRIEIDALKPHSYPPGEERPIGIFIKVSTRTFVYALVMPGDRTYNEVLDYINGYKPRTKPNEMRRFYTSIEELRINCPHLAFWLI